MSTSEIERVLRLNHGKTVKVRHTNGTFATLSVDSLDQEGCGCHVFGHPDYDPNLLYWWAFNEIADGETA
jgi:hypothetical protein